MGHKNMETTMEYYVLINIEKVKEDINSRLIEEATKAENLSRI